MGRRQTVQNTPSARRRVATRKRSLQRLRVVDVGDLANPIVYWSILVDLEWSETAQHARPPY
jgi:hypothetical protein